MPGEFKVHYPQEIVLPNMVAGRVDEYYSQGRVCSLTWKESGIVTEREHEKYGKYAIFGEYMYSEKYYLAVLCHEDPGKEYEFFEKAPSIYIKIHYYYLPEELWVKYDNVISSIEHNIELSEMEALDIAFIPKFISKEHKAFVTESLAKRFKNAIIPDKELRMDVAVILGAMILKNIDGAGKVNELMEDIGMRQVEDEIRILAQDEFGGKLKIMKAENRRLEYENSMLRYENARLKEETEELKKNIAYKKGIIKLKELETLNSPEAKDIIEKLLLL